MSAGRRGPFGFIGGQTFRLYEGGRRGSKGEGGGVVDEQVKRLFSRFRTADKPGSDPPPLTPEQLARIRAIAFDTARRMQLSPDQAGLLADSTVGGLAVA